MKRKLALVMNQSVEANGYEFFFESERLQPSIGQGRITHEVKVIRIYDRRNDTKMVRRFHWALSLPRQ